VTRRLIPSILLAGLLFSGGCDTHCLSERELLWEAGPDEYRLELTNLGPYLVELYVNEESVGVFCSGVEKLPVGNFPRNPCSEIRAEFLDNPGSIRLDDCDVESGSPCEANNGDGRTCYDTSFVDTVEARLD